MEILTSKSQHVQPSWINFATTAKAKAKIMAILKREQRGMQQSGEEILRDFFNKEGLEFTPDNSLPQAIGKNTFLLLSVATRVIRISPKKKSRYKRLTVKKS